MLFINNADSPYSTQRVSLASTSYTVELKFNSRNISPSKNGWYLGLYNSSGEVEIISGIKLAPNQNLLSRYIVEGFEGALVCIRVKNDFAPLGRDNLGRTKTYRLAWLSEAETILLGVSDVTQLS